MHTQGKAPKSVNRTGTSKAESNYFLAAAAHDLRNPISGILSASECLLEELPEAPEGQLTLLLAIQSSSRLVLRLIDDMVEGSAGAPGTPPFHLEPTDLISLVKQDLALNELIARRKGIHLDLTIRDYIPPMDADPEKVHQVVDNLLKSAVEFSLPDSTIEIGVEMKEEQVVLSVRGHGESAEGSPGKDSRFTISFPASYSIPAQPRLS